MENTEKILRLYRHLKNQKLFEESDLLREFLCDNGVAIYTDKNGNSIFDDRSSTYIESIKTELNKQVYKIITLRKLAEKLLIKNGLEPKDVSHEMDKLLGHVKETATVEDILNIDKLLGEVK